MKRKNPIVDKVLAKKALMVKDYIEEIYIKEQWGVLTYINTIMLRSLPNLNFRSELSSEQILEILNFIKGRKFKVAYDGINNKTEIIFYI